jgi:hypothetical protein
MPSAAKSLAAAAAVAGCFALLGAAPALGDAAFPGTYEDVARKSSVRITVEPTRKATLRYRAKTACGKISLRVGLGSLADGAFRKRVGASKKRGLGTIIVKGSVAQDARTIGGLLRSSARSKCTVTRRFQAKRDFGDSESGVGAGDLGHYAGTTTEGLPVSFDVVGAPGSDRTRVENFAFDIYAECLDLRDDDGYLELTAHVTGLSGGVDSWRDFSLWRFADPDPEYNLDDIDYGVDGNVENGVASGDLDLTAGLFDDAGALSPVGPWQCEESSFDFVEFQAQLQG